MSDKTQLSQLISKHGADLGLDNDSSSTIIGNLGGSVTPMCTFTPLNEDEEESDDHKIILFAVDGSGSMGDVVNDVLDSFNDVIIPGLCAEVLDAGIVGGIRVGGISFSSGINHLWGGGVQPIKDVPSLTRSDYYSGGMTALHQAVLDLMTMGATQALQLSQITGTNPEVTLVCLSDGGNNQSPMDSGPIRDAMKALDPEIFTTVFIGFETNWGADDFQQIAEDLGFREIQEVKAKPGETVEEQKQRFRNCMGVFSQKLIQRASTSTVGITSGGDGSTGFWQND